MNIDVYYKYIKKEDNEKQKIELDEDYERLIINELFVAIKNEDDSKFNLLIDKINLILPFSFQINYVAGFDNNEVSLEVDNKYYNVLQAAIINLESNNKYLNKIINKYDNKLKDESFKDKYNQFNSKYVQYEIIKSGIYNYELINNLINKNLIESSSFNEYVYIHNYKKNDEMKTLVDDNFQDIVDVYMNFFNNKRYYMYNSKHNIRGFLELYVNKYINYETIEFTRKNDLDNIFRIYKELKGLSSGFTYEMPNAFKNGFLKIIAIEDIDINFKITSNTIKDEFSINAKDLEDIVKYKYEILNKQTKLNANQDTFKIKKI